jgi:hypothetical protein
MLYRVLSLGIAAALLLGCSNGASTREITPWAKQFGLTGAQSLTGLAVGAEGQVALTGSFTQQIDFGGGELSSAGGDDIFVSVLDDGAGPRWSGRTGSFGQQSGRAVAVAGNGDVLLAGNFTGTISFGQGKFSGANPSVFLARFAPSGQPLWVRTFGDDVGSVFVSGLAVTKNGGVVIGGRFSDVVSFGGEPLLAPGQAAYVAQLDADGAPVFSLGFGGTNHSVTSLTTDTLGSIVVTGVNNGTLQLGGASFSTSGQSVFLAKLDPDGTPRWMVQLGDADKATSYTVTTDVLGDVFVAGEFASTISFGDKNIPASSGRDGFVARLSSAGQPLWLMPFGDAAASASVRAAVADSAGHVVFTGQYLGNVDFGGGPLARADNQRAFLAELDGDGGHVASRSFDSTAASSGEALGFDIEGGLVVGGTFNDSIHVGGGTLVSESSRDIFLVRERR